MIQRKQSIFLLLVILISVTFFIPSIAPFAYVFSGSSKEFDITLNIAGVYTKCVSIDAPGSYTALIAINSLIILLTLYCIFRYSKRLIQIKLCYIIAVFVALLMGGMYMFSNLMMRKTADAHVVYLIGFYLPLVQLILLYMAGKSIKADDDLVKSSDRLR